MEGIKRTQKFFIKQIFATFARHERISMQTYIMERNTLRYIIAAVLSALLLGGCGHGNGGTKHADADSTYTVGQIRKIAAAEPERALALLDTAEQRQLLSPFDVNALRCEVYHNGLSRYKTAFVYARKAYEDPEARKNPEKFLSLLSIMADECHTNGDYAASVAYCAEGLGLARKAGNRNSEANFHVTWGLNLLEMRQYDEAFRRIDRAIGILKDETDKNPCYQTWDDLFYAMTMKLSLLWDKDRYEEALALHPLVEEALRQIESNPETPDRIADMRRAEMDVLYCCIAYATDDRTRGDSLLHRVESNPYTSTPDGEYVRIPCLLLAKRYDEALRYVRREKRLLQESTDTVNWDHINSHLQMELEAYQGKGDWRSASRVQSAMLALSDTLRRRERQEDALELAEIYGSKAKDLKIKEEQDKNRLAWTLTGSVCLLLAVAGGFTLAVVRKNREISRKNGTLTASLNEMTDCRKDFLRKQEEVIALQGEVARLSSFIHEKRDMSAGGVPDGDVQPEPEGTEDDRRLFDRIKYEIEKRELFLQKDFDKEAFAKEMNVSPRRLGKLFTTFSGKPLSEYLHDLRLAYALSLLHDNPNWSLDAVADKCGLSLRTFHRLFTRKFGMTPQAYKKMDTKESKQDSTGNQ